MDRRGGLIVDAPGAKPRSFNSATSFQTWTVQYRDSIYRAVIFGFQFGHVFSDMDRLNPALSAERNAVFGVSIRPRLFRHGQDGDYKLPEPKWSWCFNSATSFQTWTAYRKHAKELYDDGFQFGHVFSDMDRAFIGELRVPERKPRFQFGHVFSDMDRWYIPGCCTLSIFA